MKFKNIVTYYLDGRPNGVRRCRIEGPVIEALVIPREAVKDAKALADVLPKHGIYFLIEDKEGIDLPKMVLFFLSFLPSLFLFLLYSFKLKIRKIRQF